MRRNHGSEDNTVHYYRIYCALIYAPHAVSLSVPLMRVQSSTQEAATSISTHTSWLRWIAPELLVAVKGSGLMTFVGSFMLARRREFMSLEGKGLIVHGVRRKPLGNML